MENLLINAIREAVSTIAAWNWTYLTVMKIRTYLTVMKIRCRETAHCTQSDPLMPLKSNQVNLKHACGQKHPLWHLSTRGSWTWARSFFHLEKGLLRLVGCFWFSPRLILDNERGRGWPLRHLYQARANTAICGPLRFLIWPAKLEILNLV